MRPDRPPGRERESGSAVALTPSRPPANSPPPPPSSNRGPSRSTIQAGTGSGRDEALRLSDERDRWERLVLDWARSAYRRGYQVGHDAGYRAGYELAGREWKIVGGGMTHLGGPTYAEQDRRRYPPGGRASWIIPRPGDEDGGQQP